MKIRDWFHAADFLFPVDTATGRHCIKTVDPSVTEDMVANRTIPTPTRKWIAVEGGYVD